jgi:hypothetical protein
MHLSNLFKKRKQGSLGLHWYKGKSFLWNLVQFIINFDLINNDGKFKEGDVVRYNWMAKVVLGKKFLNGEEVWRKSLLVTEVLYSSKSNVEYLVLLNSEVQGSCAMFWLRKAYWWEI